jgi:hypothetical protein
VSTDVEIKQKFERLAPMLDERTLRLFAAAEADAIGYGGVSRLCRITGLARSTIVRGQQEMSRPSGVSSGRVRRSGAGRKRTCDRDATLVSDLESLVEPLSRGDPMSPLRWTCKSIRTLAAALKRMGHVASHRLVWATLRELNYSLQGNRKMEEGNQHPDRNAQFEHINAQAKAFQRAGEPVVSVDTKKKELVGDFANRGKEWQPAGEPVPVRVHDFIDKKLGKAVPYGVYDVARNEGWVNVGIDHDTAEFAVESIRRWWWRMGRYAYPAATELLITADAGGSNGYRTRLWKVELQKLARDTGLRITVAHYPPGTSKWNKIEHRMFSFITQNWRGRPLLSVQTVVSLIANTTTATGLKIKAALDTRAYDTALDVSDEALAAINLRPSRFHGDWNYAIG